jgi:hypothetical protein
VCDRVLFVFQFCDVARDNHAQEERAKSFGYRSERTVDMQEVMDFIMNNLYCNLEIML